MLLDYATESPELNQSDVDGYTTTLDNGVDSFKKSKSDIHESLIRLDSKADINDIIATFNPSMNPQITEHEALNSPNATNPKLKFHSAEDECKNNADNKVPPSSEQPGSQYTQDTAAPIQENAPSIDGM